MRATDPSKRASCGSCAGRVHTKNKAAETLVEQLGSDDLLSLVVYDDTVDTILPPDTVSDKQAIRETIRNVRAGGTTNLSGGWLKGCEHVLARRGADMIHRVLLLTDGQANVGVVDPKVLTATARQKADAGAPATDVVLQISRIGIAKAKDTAIELADNGDVARAAQTLHQMSADLRQHGLDEHFEIAEELAQLEHFAERLERRQFDSTSRKEMRDQSYQARMRSRADLSLRGTAGGSAADLETTAAVNGGVELACSREGGKLRMRVTSEGYDQAVNVQFPRTIREEGVHYVVDALHLSANGTFYRAVGKIRRLALPGQEHLYKGARRSGTTIAGQSGSPQASKVSARTAADLETTASADHGVLVQCIRESSKLRARVVSDGYDPN